MQIEIFQNSFCHVRAACRLQPCFADSFTKTIKESVHGTELFVQCFYRDGLLGLQLGQLIYDDDGEISEVGTYEIDEDEIELTSIEGYDKEGKFNAEENKVGINGNFYKIKDKKATLDFKMTDDYLDTLEAKIEDATDKVLEDEEVYEEATWYSYYIYDDALLNPDTLYEEALAKELDYANDKTLKALIEGNYLEIDVYIYDYDDINIYFYCY